MPVVSPEGTNWGGEKISIISRKLLIANVKLAEKLSQKKLNEKASGNQENGDVRAFCWAVQT